MSKQINKAMQTIIIQNAKPIYTCDMPLLDWWFIFTVVLKQDVDFDGWMSKCIINGKSTFEALNELGCTVWVYNPILFDWVTYQY